MQQYSPKELATTLSFEDGMKVADDIFTWDHRSGDVINYVIDVFFAIRDHYPEKWNQDWKNDLYVTIPCEIVLRYQEIYDSCKSVYERLLPDPPALVLFYFANCYFLPPEVDTISQDAAIKLFKKSIDKKLAYEAALLLRNIYNYRNDKANYDYWDAIAKDAERKNLHNPVIIPDVLKPRKKND